MATPPPPPPLTNDDLVGALSDDLLEEFLRRLPPDDPASLVRASMVCKRWRRILADPGFCRRLCDHHHHRVPAPPMLGFFGRKFEHARKGTNPRFFTPTSSFRPRTAGLSLGWFRYVVHAGHGRVLLAGLGGARLDPITGLLEQQPSSRRFAVWGPITGDLLELPRLQRWQATDAYFSWNAVVLCGSAANNCDHLDCHRRGPFLVVFVGTSAAGVYSYVYSSQAGTWSHTASVAREAADLVSTRLYKDGFYCNIVVGKTVFFRLMDNIRVLKYDLSTEEICSVDLPAQCRSVCSEFFLTTTKSGELGVTGVDTNLWILLWSREASPDGHFRWTPPSRVIDLSVVPQANNLYPYRVVDILHSLGAIRPVSMDSVTARFHVLKRHQD